MDNHQAGLLHSKAMELAEAADLAKLRKDVRQYHQLIEQAFVLEAQAAHSLSDSDSEPSRSVLYRSAASLAVECQRYREAEKLVAHALIGNPPEEIIEELRAILETIHFQLNLQQKGIKIESKEIRLAIAGREMGYGFAPSDLVLDRLNNVKTMIHRTIERMRNIDYREGGLSKIANLFPVYLIATKPSSFEIRLTIGEPQTPLPGLSDPADDILKEVFTCVEMVNNSEEEALRQRIPDQAYFNNFISHMKKIAPDGELVASVQFSAAFDGEVKSLALERRKQSILSAKTIIERAESGQDVVQLKGKLRFADGLSDSARGKIKLLTPDGRIPIIIPEGMDDIVSQLWNQYVDVICQKEGKNKLVLVDIDRSKSDPE
jgi:hypothetical protein